MRTITGVATSIALFLGWAARGATDRAVCLASFGDYEREYGGLDTRTLLGYAVKQFFENGGSGCYVIRLGATEETVLAPGTAPFHAAVIACFADGGIADRIDLFNLVVVPGETDAATLATLQAHCRRRRAFLIVDCPADATVASLVANGLGGLTGPDACNSAIYHPWVRQPDPLQPGVERAFPPSGFVAGVHARIDAARGVWKAPAGIEAKLNVTGAKSVLVNDAENGQLNRLGINCIRTLPPHGTVVWGARTLHGQDGRASEWKYVPVRRLALFLEESLIRGTQWAVFEPNDELLWAALRDAVGAFLNGLFRQGAFFGTTPKEAFLVKCDRETTTQDDVGRGIVNLLVMFAPLKPAEFVVVRIQQRAGQRRPEP